MLTIGAPIRNSTEAVVGIATVSVDARQLAFALQELDPTGTSQSFLIDPANGTFVSVSGRNDLFMKEVSGVAWGKFALELRDSAEPRSLDLAAGTRWFHRTRLKNGLVFGMSVPEQEALGSVTAVSALLHNEAAMIILVALLLVFPISAFALRPIWYPPELRQVDRRNSEPSFDSRGQLFMDPAQQSRARFIEAVSHEIREPVASILSTAEASDGAPTQAEAAGALMLIQGRALGILSVLDDLLDLAALEDGTLVVRRSAFRLRETLDRVLQTVQTQVERKRIVLHCEIHNEVPDELIGDAARLGQVLVYMLQNSVRFTPDLGGILILVSSITRPSGRIELQFAVSDSGIGIPAGKVQAIFEPYKRGHDASLHTQKTGAGLGLTIARALVERMGGEVRVESREGVGTTFRFMVVVIDQASHDLAAPKVLVVDADGRDEGLPALLVQAGVPFCIASDTAELDGLLAQENLRLVLLDVPIDDRIGVALLSAISAPDGRHRFVPVVGFKDRRHEKTSLLDSVVSGWVDRPVDWGGANEVVSRFAVSVADVAETGSES
jgi:signal transduction histidine kinase